MSSDLVISQQLLEQNEDIIAAVVENLQLGRLNDCMQHYAILQANLVALATELDNFPAEEFDPYAKLNIFPDDILRKDVLEDLRPPGYRTLPSPPIVPACYECMTLGITAVQCRCEMLHVEPNNKFSETEQEEFIHATQVISARHQQFSQDAQSGKSRRIYKNWSEYEHYTLAVGWHLFGMNMEKLCQLLQNRTETQIRSKISHKQKDGEWPPKPVAQLMNERDPNYQPPPLLSHYFAAHATGIDPMKLKRTHDYSSFNNSMGGNIGTTWGSSSSGQYLAVEDGGSQSSASMQDDEDLTSAHANTQSLLAPTRTQPDFNHLLSIAAEVQTYSTVVEEGIGEDEELYLTRVPPSPSTHNLLSSLEDTPECVMIISDVGISRNNKKEYAERSIKLESAYTAVAKSSDETVRTMRTPTVYSNKDSIAASHTLAPRHVHWDADVLNNETNKTHSETAAAGTIGLPSTQCYLPPPPAGTTSYLPPPPAGPTSYLPPPPAGTTSYLPPSTGTPLNEVTSSNTASDSRGDAHQLYIQQQQLVIENQRREQEERERCSKQETALQGLDAYNLEYVRKLQQAGVSFRMTTNTGTVVVKPTPTSTVAESPAQGSSTTRKRNKPPPFAQPGINRMKQQQQQQTPESESIPKKRKLAPPGNESTTITDKEEVVSLSQRMLTENMEAASQQQLLQQQLCMASQQPQHDALALQYNLANHRQQLIQNHNQSTAQLKKTFKAATKKQAGSDKTASTTGTGSNNSPSSWPSTAASTGRLFDQILASSKVISSSGSSVNSNSTGNRAYVQAPGYSASSSRPQSAASNRQAALEVSMSGYEDEETSAPSRISSTARGGRSSSGSGGNAQSQQQLSEVDKVQGEELSALPEFGCEFSFM